MSVPRGTTPTFTLTFPQDAELDLCQARGVYVSFRSGGKTLTKAAGDDGVNVEQDKIHVWLNQEETLLFYAGTIMIQANWTTADGQRAASEIVSCQITENLLPKVVE